jgi:protein O-mannosyl-transferase
MKKKTPSKQQSLSPSPPSESLLLRWAPFWIVALSLLLYVNTLGHQFALDDAIVITENSFTQQGWKGFKGILTKDTFFGFFMEEGKANLVSGGRYRPLSLLLFALEYQFFGENPFLGHLFNLLWYALTCFLLWKVLRSLLSSMDAKSRDWISLIGTLLFVAHPLHTEVVANIKGRDEILALFFSLLSLYSYLCWVDKGKWKYLGWASLSLFLGLLAKENTITFLFILPLSAWVFRGQKPTRPAPWLAIIAPAMLFLTIRHGVLGQTSTGIPPMELMNNPFLKYESGKYILMPFGEKMATIFHGLLIYLKLLIFPHPLTHDYYPRHIEIKNWSSITSLLALGIYTFLGIYALLKIKTKNIYAYSILYYLATLSVVSNLFFPVGTHLSERFLFMPSVAFTLAAGYFLYRPGASIKPLFAHMISLVLIIGFGFSTIARNPVWYDNSTLFLTDVKTSVNSAKLQNAAGGEKIRLGFESKDENYAKTLYQEAIVHLNKAIDIHPLYKNAYLLKGNAYVYLEEYTLALESYAQALRLDPGYKEAYNNRLVALRKAGQYYGEKRGDLNQSIAYLKEAHTYDPKDYETNRLLGIAYALSGKPEVALGYFQTAVELLPEEAGAWMNLGMVFGQLGNIEASGQAFAKAKQLDPTLQTPQ